MLATNERRVSPAQRHDGCTPALERPHTGALPFSSHLSRHLHHYGPEDQPLLADMAEELPFGHTHRQKVSASASAGGTSVLQ